MQAKRKIVQTAAILGCAIACVSPALAKHVKETQANIFTPPAEQLSQPSFGNKESTTPVVARTLLDGKDEPSWDIIKSLPDLQGDQTKSLNKLQQDTQKSLNVMRTQMNEAQQELTELKAHKTPKPKVDGNPAIALLNPDGKPYMGPLLGTEEMGMDPAEESIDDVQAQIDGLKDRIKDTNLKAAAQTKTILSGDQMNELELMRQGRLVVSAPKNILVDSPADPSSRSRNKHELASSTNAGTRVLRTILSGAAKGIRGIEQN